MSRRPGDRLCKVVVGEAESMIIDGIRSGLTQRQIAVTYAVIITQLGSDANWPKINRAIRKRWKGKTALKRVKRIAWAHIRELPEARHGE